LLDITTTKYINIQNKTAGVSGNNFVRNENKLVRSPGKDCYVTTPARLSKAISFSGLTTETPEIKSKEELKTFLETLKDEKGKPKFHKTQLKDILASANTPEHVQLVVKLAKIEGVNGDQIAAITIDTKTAKQALLKTDLALEMAKIKNLSSIGLATIIYFAQTPEHANLAKQLAQIKKLAPCPDNIGDIIQTACTSKQALVKVDLAGKLAKMGKLSAEEFTGILINTRTPEHSHLAEELTKIERMNGEEIIALIQDLKEPKLTLAKADLASKLAPIEKLDGKNLAAIIFYTNTPEHALLEADLANKIATNEKINGDEFTSIIYHANTSERANLAEKLAKIERLDGMQILNVIQDIQNPEEALAKTDLLNKLAPIEKIDGRNLSCILHNADTPEKALIKSSLADKLAPMEKIDDYNIAYILNAANTPELGHLINELTKIEKFGGEHIASIIQDIKTPEEALVKADLASKLAPIEKINDQDLARILYHTKTPEQANFAEELTKTDRINSDMISTLLQDIQTPEEAFAKTDLLRKLTPIEKIDNQNLASILYYTKTPEHALIKADLASKLAPMEKISAEELINIVYYSEIPEQANLAKKLTQIERFSGEDIATIVSCAKTPKQNELAENLAQIEKLNGHRIAVIVHASKTPEEASARADFATKLAPIEKFHGAQIEWMLGLANTPEQVLLRTALTNKLAPIERFDGYDISVMAGHIETDKEAALTLKLAEDKAFTAKFDAQEEKLLGNSLLVTAIRANIDPEKLDFERLTKLYKFMIENKTVFEQFDEGKISDRRVSRLFTPNMVSSLDILDDGVIKYAMKLKFDGFDNFIDDTSELKNKLSPENYSLLKENLTKLTMPEQKMDKIQCITSLTKGNFSEQAIKEGINLIKSSRTTVNQIKTAEDIFTSNKSYPEQTQEFLTKFNVPAERQDKIVAFLEKNKLNEKVIVDNKTGAKTLSNNVKQELAQQIEAHINVINNNKEFNNFINKKLYKKLEIEPTPKLLEKLNFDQQYLPKLFSEVTSDNSSEFKKLIELVNANPTKPLSELRESLPNNQETKELFKENKINYKKWINFDENSFKSFSFETNVEDAIKNIEKNIVEELNGDLFKSVDKIQTNKFLNNLETAGYKIDAEKITKNGETIGQKDLEKIVDVFKETINENKIFWDKPLADAKQESLKNELVDHLLKGRKKEVADLAQMKNTKMDLNVRLSDDNNIGRNIFLGNHVGCCTAVGGCNQFAAPQHLMNSFVRAIEIVDKSNNSYGNSMCYFAKVDDKLSFIVDSFEANGKLGGNVAVTDAIVDYAKQVTKEMGKPGIPIFFGPNYNKINMDKLEKTQNHTVEVIGRVENETYIDAIGGNADVNVAHTGRDLYKIK